jgi:hypothetical protein
MPRGPHPAPKSGPVCPLNQNLDARLQHFMGDGPVHRDGGLQVCLAGAQGVERIGIGVVGDEDDIQVRRGVAREIGRLAYEVILAIDRLGHGKILKRDLATCGVKQHCNSSTHGGGQSKSVRPRACLWAKPK